MLNHLRGETREPLHMPLQLLILIFHQNLLISQTRALAVQRQAPFLRREGNLAIRDDRVKHHQHGFPRHHRNDALADANHVRRHADALVRMGAQGIHEVTRNGQILRRRHLALAGQEHHISHNRLNHCFFTTTPPVFQMLLSGTSPRTQLSG